MPELNESSKPEILDYATPPGPRWRRGRAAGIAIIGVAVGLLGLDLLMNGIGGVIYYFGSGLPTGLYRPTIVFLIGGVVCIYAAIRWCRAASRISAGR